MPAFVVKQGLTVLSRPEFIKKPCPEALSIMVLFQDSNFPMSRVCVHDGLGCELTYAFRSILPNYKEFHDGARVALNVYLIICKREASPFTFHSNDICRPVRINPEAVQIAVAILTVLIQVCPIDLGKIVLVKFHQISDYQAFTQTSKSGFDHCVSVEN